jgi:hypothetical protein
MRDCWYFSASASACARLSVTPNHQVDHRGLVRRQRDGAPERDDRIKHGAGGVRERPGLRHRGRPRERSAAPDEAGPVRLAGRFAVAATLPDQQVQQPRRFLVPRTRPPGAQERGRLADEFRLHEKIAERRMRGVGRGGGEHDLGVARQLNHRVATGSDWSA